MRDPSRQLRCAIYTRKSSEEGLEQDFNSLHAQREACEAYVTSQKHEGWKAIPVLYDDGGSGGTMERPGLSRLLTDIASGLVDVVVVYKVDRLTRSLTDFARIVDVFDQKGVSFVSVTQAFNTTSSMGRLTLNVLLSFAQFEREVTGERIRDKIAASKKKGLWMGGFVPIGYEAAGRTLVINEDEAQTVRLIYELYLEQRSVDALTASLAHRGLLTKIRTGESEGMTGGRAFSRGHLHRILQNPLYAGKIAHKGKVYGGQHPAIIDPALWLQVQELLADNCQGARLKVRAKNPSLLTGLLVDASRQPLLASHAVKRGRRYRYYVSASLMKRAAGRKHPAATPRGSTDRKGWRVPAGEVDDGVIRILSGLLCNETWVLAHMAAPQSTIAVRQAALARAETFAAHLQSSDPVARRTFVLGLVEQVMLTDTEITLTIKTDLFSEFAAGREAPIVETCPLILTRRGAETRLILEGSAAREPEPDPVLTKGLAQAHRWWKDLLSQRYTTMREIAQAYQTDERYVARIIMLAFLPAARAKQILDGTQPSDLTLHSFLKDDEVWLAAEIA
ncbi:recombinase family protein [Microvirga brassicacearum]|uniref:Recombinase family protein n=1 Tax=Microvirga brassicacearum TaxID=2580413 RepID=A0A5N3PHK0_9HYPH|nr:recombinase family protein [Microvirga brassicacearum]KAB0269143.1 recombinase family protein [Microvirga brassicacearum]